MCQMSALQPIGVTNLLCWLLKIRSSTLKVTDNRFVQLHFSHKASAFHTCFPWALSQVDALNNPLRTGLKLIFFSFPFFSQAGERYRQASYGSSSTVERAHTEAFLNFVWVNLHQTLNYSKQRWLKSNGYEYISHVSLPVFSLPCLLRRACWDMDETPVTFKRRISKVIKRRGAKKAAK